MKQLLGILFLFSTFLTGAQRITNDTAYKKAIAYGPLALLNTDLTFLLSGEYRFSKKLSVTADAGYIFASYYIEAQQAAGFNLRPSLRLYFGKDKRSYWQNGIFYKQVTYRIYDWLGKECVNETPAYDQLQHFQFRKQVLGFHSIIGSVVPVFSERWFLDIYAGLGMRVKYQKIIHQPHSCYNRLRREWFDLYQPRMVAPSLPIGLKVGYRFN